jgi:hypothetical protein
MSTAARFRDLALGYPEAEEKAHFAKPDFRVRNKIFASLPVPELAVVKLAPEQQDILTGAEPNVFRPVPGGWGRKGWTEIVLAAADDTTLASALAMAWRNVAPKSLRA